jgi:hypothetical protein
MPPRYAYWTIIVDDQPTAFRSGTQEELMPTFKRLKAKNDSAVMMWWQNGKLWPSRVDAQEMMRARGEMGRRNDDRQTASSFRDRERKPTRERSAWTPRGVPSTPPPARNAADKLDWKPKGEFVPAPKRADRPERSGKPDWKPKASIDRESKPAWKPKGSFGSEPKPEWKPKTFKRPDFKPSAEESRSAKPEWKPKGSFDRGAKPTWKSKPSSGEDFKPSRSEKPEWKPKGSFTPAPRRPAGFGKSAATGSMDRQAFRPPRPEKPEWKPKGARPDAEGRAPRRSEDREGGGDKRKWVPKEEYKRSMGIEAKRDSKWRPGGEHKDPRQKYKDAKKAKWTKFKQNIRARSGGKSKKSS